MTVDNPLSIQLCFPLPYSQRSLYGYYCPLWKCCYASAP